MLSLPVFVGLDYHSKVVQVCVMDQKRNILLNTSVENDPEAVFRIVCPFGSNVHVVIEACTGAADFAETSISKYKWSVSLAHAVVRHLLQQPGIGLITATTMRAMIGHFDRFRTGKQLAHFCAVCPRNNSTGGKTTTAGLVKAGDPLLRNVLLEAAHRLMRYDPHWKSMADRLRANKKKGSVIAAAVANRWIRKLFHQMMDFHGKLKTASIPFKEKCETVSAKPPCPVGKVCTTAT